VLIARAVFLSEREHKVADVPDHPIHASATASAGNDI